MSLAGALKRLVARRGNRNAKQVIERARIARLVIENAAVTIYNDTDSADPFTFAVKGTGTAAPKAQIVGNGKIIPVNDTLTSVLDNTSFGSTETASGSISKTFTIKNLGSATMNLSGTPKVAISGVDANDFVVTTQPPATIAAGAQADFVV